MGVFAMTKIRNPLALLAGLALMAPALALAWPSSHYGSSPQAQARDGAMPAPIAAANPPSNPAPAYPNGPMDPHAQAMPYPGPGMNSYGNPYGPGFGPGYGFQPPAIPDFPAPPALSRPNRSGPLRFNQTLTEEGYILEIPLNGMKAEEIQVDIDGRSIRLSRDTSTQKTREETFDDDRGYLRSYSFSSGRSSRRLPLPQDADGGAMRREDSAEEVRIIIPRRQG